MDINKVRLASIFRSLRPTRATEANTSPPPQGNRNSATVASQTEVRRDPDRLKERLRQRLQRLKRESDQFDVDAPVVTIQEILIWEFGDEVLEHAEFKHISDSLLQTLSSNGDLQQHMKSLVESLLE